jgi:hypothetical protein
MEASGQPRAPAALLPWNELRYSVDRNLGDPRSRSRRCGEEKIFWPYQESNPGQATRSQIAIPIGLFRLPFITKYYVYIYLFMFYLNTLTVAQIIGL